MLLLTLDRVDEMDEVKSSGDGETVRHARLRPSLRARTDTVIERGRARRRAGQDDERVGLR
jgi:hypothetical protein